MKQVVTMVKILDAQVCSEGTWDDALEFIQRTSPAGTQNNWQKNEEPNFEPVTCEDDPNRTHYMFVC